MQLQNKEVKIKINYSIVLDQDEMNNLIQMLRSYTNSYPTTATRLALLRSLEAFRGEENEPTHA